MEVQITGKGIDLGQALQIHVSEKMEDGVHKYFTRPAEAQVTFAKEGHDIKCEATAHLASGVYLAAHGEGGDAYGAFDAAMERLEKRVRRYKSRLKEHHGGDQAPMPVQMANAYVLQALGEEVEDEPEQAPIVIAESTTSLREMTVGSAVMQLDLQESSFFVFKNAAHGQPSVVYKREDGNIGWLDMKG